MHKCDISLFSVIINLIYLGLRLTTQTIPYPLSLAPGSVESSPLLLIQSHQLLEGAVSVVISSCC